MEKIFLTLIIFLFSAVPAFASTGTMFITSYNNTGGLVSGTWTNFDPFFPSLSDPIITLYSGLAGSEQTYFFSCENCTSTNWSFHADTAHEGFYESEGYYDYITLIPNSLISSNFYKSQEFTISSFNCNLGCNLTSIPTPTPTPTPTDEPTSTPTPTMTPTPSPTLTSTPTNTPTPTITPIPILEQLTVLSPAKVWVGLENILSIGTLFDLKAEVYKENNVVSSGQINSFYPGISGFFATAILATIPFNSFAPKDFPMGTNLKVKISVRNSCYGSLRNRGTARLWYNDALADSRFGAAIGSSMKSYYLLNNFSLGAGVGAKRKFVDVEVGKKCGPFKSFGTWSLL